MSNRRIQVSDLDFDQIRENLKTYMSGQTTFSDYNFEGSALATLLDVLAYNTHYNALYTNLAVNEMFLDSASKRSSVVSIANNFGYTPSSSVSSQATVRITVTNATATAQTLTIAKWSPFVASIENVPYIFYTIEDYTAQLINGVYTFEDVILYEGIPRTLTFVCTQADEKFILPYKNLDLSTLSINIQQTGENLDYSKYSRATEVLNLDATSKVYFVKELEDESYEISFGSNNLGLPIAVGNVITATCLLTNMEMGNNASLFSYSGNAIDGTIVVTTVAGSAGGGAKESVEDIKYNISQSFFDQNRAVTPTDYASLIKREYPGLDAVSVWGGEDNEPPVYGKVFISVKPTGRSYLTVSEESYIAERIVNPKSIVSITPVFVRPSYIELDITATAYYDKSKTTRSASELQAAITRTIQAYRDTHLNSFDGVFRISKFQTAIDSVDPSITGNITTFRCFIEITPKFNLFGEYRLNLANPIYTENVPEEAFLSTGFYIDTSTASHYLDDDGKGNIRLFRYIQGTGDKYIVNNKIGTIDYLKGVVRISNLKITALESANFYFIVKTQSYDVVSVRNQIVDIPSNRITVNLVEDTVASGTRLGGTNYTFTSSRN